MDETFQTTFSNAFSRMKMYEFRLFLLKFAPGGRVNSLRIIQLMTDMGTASGPVSRAVPLAMNET